MKYDCSVLCEETSNLYFDLCRKTVWNSVKATSTCQNNCQNNVQQTVPNTRGLKQKHIFGSEV